MDTDNAESQHDHDLIARLSVVIPAYNEENGIEQTLRDLLQAAPDAEVIVVDDGSTDATAETVAHFPSVVLAIHPFNRGYGAALKTGMALASRDFVAWFDADHEHRVRDLLAMVQLLDRSRVVAVVAQRRFSGPSPMRKVGKFAIRMLARSLKFRGGADINCGLRVFRREVISRYVEILPNGFSASITSTMIMLERGYPIEYYRIELQDRIGTSKVMVADGFHAMMLVLRTIMLFAPMRIFLRLGIALFVIGGSYGFGSALVTGRGLPAASIFLLIAGVFSGFFGLIADQVSQMRLSLYDKPIYTIAPKKTDPELD